MNFQAAEMRAYHINRRDEDTDLYGVAGTLMATSNMQMQTFINGDSVVFAANQREKVNCRKAAREAALGREVRDLHDLTGALQAQPGMKQQTFVAGFSAGAGAKAGGIGYSEKISPTLKGTASGNSQRELYALCPVPERPGRQRDGLYGGDHGDPAGSGARASTPGV